MSYYRYEYHGEDIGIKEYLKDLGFSSTFIKRVKYGGVKRNGDVIHMRAVITDGDTVEVVDAEKANASILPRDDIPLKILYEDDGLLAVFKPSGMPTHPSRGNHLPTLAEAVIGHYKGQPFTFRAVNRLDKDTSGIVIVAKNAKTAYLLSNQMKNGGFRKEYDALVVGVPCPTDATVDAPIRRESEGGMKRCVAEDGKRAVTEYRVTEVMKNGNASVHIVLRTGRTHQIRVHMAYLGHPLYADALYGQEIEGKTYSLCASKITFVNPTDGKELTIKTNPQAEE